VGAVEGIVGERRCREWW